MARMFSSTTFFGETENSSFAHCGDNGRLLFPAIGGTGEPSARALDFGELPFHTAHILQPSGY
eukprot:3359122-Rhodomonas_salina.1